MDKEDLKAMEEKIRAAVKEAQEERDKARAWFAPHWAAIKADPTAALLMAGVGFIAGKWGGLFVGIAGKLIG